MFIKSFNVYCITILFTLSATRPSLYTIGHNITATAFRLRSEYNNFLYIHLRLEQQIIAYIITRAHRRHFLSFDQRKTFPREADENVIFIG